MTALLAGVFATVAAALATYVFNGFRKRRDAAADALIGALRDGQRNAFLIDLGDDDHAGLVLRPLNAWAEVLAATMGNGIPAARYIEKFDQLLEWRMKERESRIAFAVMAPAVSVRSLAEVLLAHQLRLVEESARRIERQDRYYHQGTERLIRAIVSIRVATWFLPVHARLRRVPGLRALLIRDEDIRMVVADYSELRPGSPFGRGFAELVRNY